MAKKYWPKPVILLNSIPIKAPNLNLIIDFLLSKQYFCDINRVSIPPILIVLHITGTKWVLNNQLTSIRVLEGWEYTGEKEESGRVFPGESICSGVVSVSASQTLRTFTWAEDHLLSLPLTLALNHTLSAFRVQHWAPESELRQTHTARRSSRITTDLNADNVGNWKGCPLGCQGSWRDHGEAGAGSLCSVLEGRAELWNLHGHKSTEIEGCFIIWWILPRNCSNKV